MATLIPAEIEIGGLIGDSVLPRLVEVAGKEGVLYCGSDETLTVSDLMAEISAGKPVMLYDNQASWGKFPALQEFCREHGLTFKRTCDATEEFDGEIEFWQPGMAESAEGTADNDGTPVISLTALRTAQSQGKTLDQIVLGLQAADAPVPALVVIGNAAPVAK